MSVKNRTKNDSQNPLLGIDDKRQKCQKRNHRMEHQRLQPDKRTKD